MIDGDMRRPVINWACRMTVACLMLSMAPCTGKRRCRLLMPIRIWIFCLLVPHRAGSRTGLGWLRTILDEAEREYDLVVIDSPRCLDLLNRWKLPRWQIA